jgi:membrane protease YdiL (CAAX protease family)
MSENSSSKEVVLKRTPLHKLAGKFQKPKEPREKRVYNWRMLILFPAWVAVAYVASNLIIAALLVIMDILHRPVDSFIRPSILQTVIATLIYALTIGIVIAGPYVFKRKLTTDITALGLDRLPSWTDIALAPLTFIVYTVLAGVTLSIVTSLIPVFPVNQTQDVGFTFGSQTDNVLAFLTLVVLAPLAEETLFRGYLYGKLNKYVPAVVSALITSLLFAVAHFQWNVGIDVFILSLFLCGLRSLTGSIWAGILVHMIKNGLAYYLLFISPILGG